MIKGLYEAHLQVNDLKRAIQFYQKLGLELAHLSASTAFMWIVPQQSWIGLWQSEIPQIKTTHIAFQIEYTEMKNAFAWLKQLGITPIRHKEFAPIEPIVRPAQANCSVFFNDSRPNLTRRRGVHREGTENVFNILFSVTLRDLCCSVF